MASIKRIVIVWKGFLLETLNQAFRDSIYPYYVSRESEAIHDISHQYCAPENLIQNRLVSADNKATIWTHNRIE